MFDEVEKREEFIAKKDATMRSGDISWGETFAVEESNGSVHSLRIGTSSDNLRKDGLKLYSFFTKQDADNACHAERLARQDFSIPSFQDQVLPPEMWQNPAEPLVGNAQDAEGENKINNSTSTSSVERRQATQDSLLEFMKKEPHGHLFHINDFYQKFNVLNMNRVIKSLKTKGKIENPKRSYYKLSDQN